MFGVVVVRFCGLGYSGVCGLIGFVFDWILGGWFGGVCGFGWILGFRGLGGVGIIYGFGWVVFLSGWVLGLVGFRLWYGWR